MRIFKPKWDLHETLEIIFNLKRVYEYLVIPRFTLLVSPHSSPWRAIVEAAFIAFIIVRCHALLEQHNPLSLVLHGHHGIVLFSADPWLLPSIITFNIYCYVGILIIPCILYCGIIMRRVLDTFESVLGVVLLKNDLAIVTHASQVLLDFDVVSKFNTWFKRFDESWLFARGRILGHELYVVGRLA
jgi:hypothetical protein